MAPDASIVARRVVAALEAGDVGAVRTELAERLADWDAEPWIVERWLPRLEELAGRGRGVTRTQHVNDAMVRVAVAGTRGVAYISVLLDDTGRVAGLGIDDNDEDGQFWVIIGCTDEQSTTLPAFYEALLRGPIGFGEGGSRPPVWRDHARPAQIHLDVTVRDLDEAEQTVLALGASKVEDFPDWRVYTDPVGHLFCLYPGTVEVTDRVGVLERIVLDCAKPQALARFWGEMLAMPRQVETSSDRVVIGGRPSTPKIACQRVEDYQPPRWPDPDFPAQLHFDLGYDDRPRRERQAVELGVTLLPPQGGSCPVYADPAGHPFCLCFKGE
jgi:hypothetical protein